MEHRIQNSKQKTLEGKRAAELRHSKNCLRNKKNTHLYIYFSAMCVDSEKSPSIVAKGKKSLFFPPHGVNEAVLLNTADVSSRPR